MVSSTYSNMCKFSCNYKLVLYIPPSLPSLPLSPPSLSPLPSSPPLPQTSSKAQWSMADTDSDSAPHYEKKKEIGRFEDIPETNPKRLVRVGK